MKKIILEWARVWNEEVVAIHHNEGSDFWWIETKMKSISMTELNSLTNMTGTLLNSIDWNDKNEGFDIWLEVK